MPTPSLITRTGRIQSWVDAPHGRLPVSCTVFVVEAAMGGREGVKASQRFVSHGLRYGAGCAVHLSALSSIELPVNTPGKLALALPEDHPDFEEFQWVVPEEQTYSSPTPLKGVHILVSDSMEGDGGIEESWERVTDLLLEGRDVTVHLGALRPRGSRNQRGLEASGPASFAKIYLAIEETLWNPGLISFAKTYSVFNEVLRRGGQYKNGAITLHLDWDCSELGRFLNTSRSELPWVKRCVDVPANDSWIEDLQQRGLLEDLIKAIARGDVWLNKIKYDENGNRLYGNVCLEVYLKSRATCLLLHENLGACRIEDIATGMVQGMKELLELHPRTGVGDAGEYLKPENDRQVGLGLLGLANLLAQEGVRYAELAGALEDFFGDDEHPDRSGPAGWPVYRSAKAEAIVHALHKGISDAAALARAAGMERAFCIAPTATCSYKSRDLRGFACAPEIAPPIARHVDRDSGTFGVETVAYPPDIEIAREVGYDTFRRVADGIVRLFEATGLFHGYSLNSWSDEVVYDRAFLEDWAQSPQTSLYYSLQVAPDTQAKDRVSAAVVDETPGSAEFFGFDDEEPVAACSMEDPGFCSACAE